MPDLTHFDAEGQAHMVDVSKKPITARVATADAWVKMLPKTLGLVEKGGARLFQSHLGENGLPDSRIRQVFSQINYIN